jgi:hypothetical protein
LTQEFCCFGDANQCAGSCFCEQKIIVGSTLKKISHFTKEFKKGPLNMGFIDIPVLPLKLRLDLGFGM